MIDLISFKGAQYPKSVILYAVYFYVRFPVSYRDLEEIMAERGVDLDHATLNRWVEKYAGALAEEAHPPDTDLQIAEFSFIYSCRDRSRAYDPERSV